MADIIHQKSYLFLHSFIFFNHLTFMFSQSIDNNEILHCLNNNKITNFTLHPSSKHHSSIHFNHLLKFSIQNLRVAKDSTPKPTAIILPESKEQVVNSVLCCRRSLMEIRIRSGGHSYEGMSSIPRGNNPFVIIDMMNMNRVIVDLESETAWVESGATLGELYSTIAAHSSYYGFPAGVWPSVGVGGHFSGGGIGVLSRKYGLSADNVLDVGLVDAEGRVFDRAKMGEEVFWAARGGGGGNWGVVYGWKVQLVHVPERVTCFSVTKQGTNHELAELIHKWQFVAPYLDDGFHISVYLTSGTTKEVYVTFKGLYLGSKIDARTIVNEHFPEMKILEQDYLEMRWINSVLYFSDLPKGSTINDLKSRSLSYKSYIKTKSDYVREHVSIKGLEGALEMLASEPKGLMLLDPYGGVMDRISNDSIAFPHRKGNLYNILYALFWQEEDEENRCLSWISGIYNYMTPYVASNPRAAYVNYIDLDLGTIDDNNGDIVEKARAWGEKYFLGHYERLVSIKNIIDPQNVFFHQQGIPPSKVQIQDEL
ncbi:berberine bridge enzyme-like D-2 [Amaranthus tricolor]|uniref:berberine bridge enzyme-like D-2 n=1 Tax=Amaranthus tricolor TaxID=29722 RepID=UPI00258CE4E1|nr:berberine bridge enzyme-like D-2 [Amaranthus tricolor]